MDLTDRHRTLHHKEAKYTFFSNACGTLSKIDHMTGHKQASTNSRKLKSQWLKTRYQPKGKKLKNT